MPRSRQGKIQGRFCGTLPLDTIRGFRFRSLGQILSIVLQTADSTFRYSFYAGLILALIIGVCLTRLWGAENQVRLHTEHFLSQIEERDWAGAGEFWRRIIGMIGETIGS